MDTELAAAAGLPLGRAVEQASRARGLSGEQTAAALALELPEYARLLNGSLLLDQNLAQRLEQALGGTVAGWLRLAASHVSAPSNDAWQSVAATYNRDALKALRERGYVDATRANVGVLAEQLRAFFACEPADAQGQVRAAFRQSTARQADPEAVAVWLNLADRQARWFAESEQVPALDRDALSRLMPELVKVGQQPPDQYLPQVQDKLTDVGVVLVFQADVPGTRLSGASWSEDAYAVVALTLMGARDDKFWWTLFHEVGHVLSRHGRVVEGDVASTEDGDREVEADAVAHDLLLPLDWTWRLPRVLSRQGVRAVAAELGVPAGVLVGQLHHTGRLNRSHLNDLRQPTPPAESLEVQTYRQRLASGEL